MSLIGYIKLIRPVNTFFSIATVLFGMLLAGRITGYIPVVIACVSAFLIVAGGSVLNDFFDRNVDVANNRKRPIPQKLVQPENAKIFGYLLLSLGTFTVLLTRSILLIFIAVTGAFLLHLYNSVIKSKNAILGNIVMSYCNAIIIIYGWSLFRNFSFNIIITLLIIFAIVFFASMAREFIKSIRYIKGERRFHRKTAALTLGIESTSIWATILMLMAVTLSPIPFVIGTLGISYLALMIVVDVLGLWLCLTTLRRARRKENSQEESISEYAGKAQNLLLGSMGMAILAIGLGLFI